MKTIVAGSRDIFNVGEVWQAMEDAPWVITEVVCGGARGVDSIGSSLAKKAGIPVRMFPVTNKDWNTIGPSAGPRRNRQMAEYAEALIAVWDGESRGTKNMIDEAQLRKLQVFIRYVRKP